MSETTTELRCAIEIRADDTRQSPGRLYGELMRYGERARDRAERFADGALSWPDDGIVLNVQHDRRQPLARVVPKVENGVVIIDAALPDTQRSRDTLALVREGVLKGLSVEFRAISDRWVGNVREIASAALRGAALVDEPAYSTSVEARAKRRDERRRLPAWL